MKSSRYNSVNIPSGRTDSLRNSYTSLGTHPDPDPDPVRPNRMEPSLTESLFLISDGDDDSKSIRLYSISVSEYRRIYPNNNFI